MDFIDKLREIAVRLPKQLEHIQTEEATKNALVMPFIAALGYNVFDPTEVTPELCADVGTKKGEKVDYAILKDGEPIILFECKHHAADLSKEHASQLYRYFSVTDARFGVLTNGVSYRFYTDLEAPNKMDSKPFFEFTLTSVTERDAEELKKFTKSAFDLSTILTTASELKYTREIKRIMSEQLQEPSEDFVRFFVSQVYNGKITQSVREQFAPMVQRALRHFINDQINERLKTALASETSAPVESPPATETKSAAPETNGDVQDAVATTNEEIEGHLIIKAILRDKLDVKRIIMRDAKQYCAILLDDNNRKPICRLWFNRTQKYVGFLDAQKQEERIPIEGLDDIYKLADRLRDAVDLYDKKPVMV